jgi:hypothetical protein
MVVLRKLPRSHTDPRNREHYADSRSLCRTPCTPFVRFAAFWLAIRHRKSGDGRLGVWLFQLVRRADLAFQRLDCQPNCGFTVRERQSTVYASLAYHS